MSGFSYKRKLTIVSGGQTGVDRAALDFAITNNIPHGGWCPRGRLAEDERIPADYRLTETPTHHYPQRTEWNVRDSDGTLIISRDTALTGGTALTKRMAEKLFKPLLEVSEELGLEDAHSRLPLFIEENAIETLNVAGPRESTSPGITHFATRVLAAL